MRSLKSAASLALLLGVGGMAVAVPTTSSAYIGISVRVPPPPLPYDDQPPIPGYGYIWTPGYWAWDQGYQDYYWVPGAWVLPPRVGYLWTPGWWGWDDGEYVFNPGYWGPQIGYYGGIDYGFGYNGFGYFGGEWRGDRFYYNRGTNNVRDLRGDHVYDRDDRGERDRREGREAGGRGRPSFSGGRGGVQARPTPEQMDAARAPRLGETPMQRQHLQSARGEPDHRAPFNPGAPPAAGMGAPGGFGGQDMMRGRGAPELRGGPAAAEGYRPRWEAGVGYGSPRPGDPVPRQDGGRQYSPQVRPQRLGPDDGNRGSRPQPQVAPPAQRFESRPAVMQPMQPMRAPPQMMAPRPSPAQPQVQASRPAPEPRPEPRGRPDRGPDAGDVRPR